MVNNAGIETRTSVLDTTEDQFDKVIAVNLKSAFFGTQLAAKQMIAQGGGGRIINMTSVHEDWPMPGNTPYCLSKGGMRMLTRTAGVELAPHDVLVVGVGPGAVDTPINKQTINDPAALAKLNSAIPIGRLARPEEIASIVAFLASRRSELRHGHDDLHRRRHHAGQPRPLIHHWLGFGAGSRRTWLASPPRAEAAASGPSWPLTGGTERRLRKMW